MTAAPHTRTPVFHAVSHKTSPPPSGIGLALSSGARHGRESSSVNSPSRFKTSADAKPTDEPAPGKAVHVASDSHGRADMCPERRDVAAFATRVQVRPHNRADARLR